MRRRLTILGLVVTGLMLLAALDATVATAPAFGLSLAAAWLVRS